MNIKTTKVLTASELDNETALNETFESYSAQDIIAWSYENFQDTIAITSSFQTQSVPLLHIISEVAPSFAVFFLDTGFHFAETLHYRDQLVENLNLNLHVIKPEIDHDTFKRTHGELYRRDPDMCCFINKVEPLNLAKGEYSAWISGIRRDQTPERSTTKIIEKQNNNQYKICPMVNWSEKDVWSYISKHKLPEHPLLAQGYMSIGCAPCSRPALTGEDSRSGRWSGQLKTECGLHTKS